MDRSFAPNEHEWGKAPYRCRAKRERSERRPAAAGPAIESLEGRMLLAADLTLRIAPAVRTLASGAAFRAKVVIRNIGDSAAGAFVTTLALSRDRIFGNADDIPLALVSQPGGLAAGATPVRAAVVLTVPTGTPGGRFFLVGKVDSGDAIAESDESNNVAVSSRMSVRVGVRASFPVPAPIVQLPLGRLVAPLAPATAFTTLGNIVLLSPIGPPPFSVFGLTPVIPPIESPVSFPIFNNPFPSPISPAPFGSLPSTSVISPPIAETTFATLNSPTTVPAGTFSEQLLTTHG